MIPQSNNNIYRGTGTTRQVTVNSEPLFMTEEARSASPSGFNWGYYGSGPWALAHSILAYEYGAEADTLDANKFKEDVIGELDFGRDFTLTSADIRAWVALQIGQTS